MKRLFITLFAIAVIVGIIWWRMPLIGSEWSKQTIYVGLLDAWYGASTDEKAHAMWIDDDSTEGVFKVKAIADQVGIKPAFAVIADHTNTTAITVHNISDYCMFYSSFHFFSIFICWFKNCLYIHRR